MGDLGRYESISAVVFFPMCLILNMALKACRDTANVSCGGGCYVLLVLRRRDIRRLHRLFQFFVVVALMFLEGVFWLPLLCLGGGVVWSLFLCASLICDVMECRQR